MKKEVRGRIHHLSCSHGGGRISIKCVWREEDMDGFKQKWDGD